MATLRKVKMYNDGWTKEHDSKNGWNVWKYRESFDIPEFPQWGMGMILVSVPMQKGTKKPGSKDKVFSAWYQTNKDNRTSKDNMTLNEARNWIREEVSKQ